MANCMASGDSETPLPSGTAHLPPLAQGKETFLHSPKSNRKRPPVDVSDRVRLERVLGLTVTKNASLSVDPNTGTVAYPAGCVIVLYNPIDDTQTHLISPERNTITCLAFSRDGKYLVTGESGHNPKVRLYNVAKEAHLDALSGHGYSINCVAFSPNGKYVVSIGNERDKQVIVWNFKKKNRAAYSKVTCEVEGMAFARDSSMFVTVGLRHVRFWYMHTIKEIEAVHLYNRGCVLRGQLDNTFCGVVCGLGVLANNTYVITKSGLLCEINSSRTLTRHVELGTRCANAIAIGERHIFVGCEQGELHVYNPESFELVAVMLRPHYLGIDVSSGLSRVGGNPEYFQFPDTIALVLDDNDKKLTCIYNDHSIYTWDVRSLKKIRCHLYHGRSVWGIQAYPETTTESPVHLPSNSFLTCSDDGTIRIWNLDLEETSDTTLKMNSSSNELLKVIYIGMEHPIIPRSMRRASSIGDLLDGASKIAMMPGGQGRARSNSFGEKGSGSKKKKMQGAEIKKVTVSHDGRFLASGDKQGNIRIHDLQTMDCQTMQEAYTSEVTSLHYSNPETGAHLLVSAGRDTLYVFDVQKNYEHIQTIEDHSATINAARFRGA